MIRLTADFVDWFSSTIVVLISSCVTTGIKFVRGLAIEQHSRARAGFSFCPRLEELEPRIVLSASFGTPDASIGAAPPWVAVGPAPITKGSDVLPDLLPSSQDVGAVNALAVDPRNPAHVYAATVNGGIWETKNYTAANPLWTTTSDHMPSLAISAIAISPVNNKIIYAGTGSYSSAGDGDVFAPGQGDNAAGIYKSCNGGATWTVSNPSGVFDQLRIRRVVPTSLNGGQTVFAATTDTAVHNGVVDRGGVYRSDDGGMTWARLSGRGNLPNTGVTDLVANPANPKQFFAAVAGKSGGASPGNAPNPVPSGASGIYRLDLSASKPTWTNITDNIQDLKPHVLDNAIRVELSISKAADNPIWVTTIDSIDSNYTEFSYSGVFRAPDTRTPTWTAIAPPDVLVDFEGDGKGCMLADPNDANTLYVGGDLRDVSPFTGYVARYNYSANTWTNITPNSAFAVTRVDRSAGVATLTADQDFEVGQTVVVAGLTHAAFNGTFQITAVTDTTFSYASSGSNVGPLSDNGTASPQFGPGTVVPIQTGVTSGPHPDTRGLQFGVGGDLLLACDGGVYKCANPTGTGAAVVWSSINGSLQNTEFYQVALDNRGNTDPADDLILGAAQDNGTSERAPDGTWVEHTGGDGVVVLADPASDTRYFSAANYYLVTVTGNNPMSKPPGTINGTTKYLNLAAGPDPAESLPFNVVFVLNQGDIAKGSNPARVLLAGKKNTLYLSTDKGETYTSVGLLDGSNPLPVPNITASVTAVAFGCDANPTAAYVCMSDGSISFTHDITVSKGGFGTPATFAGGEVGLDIVIDPNDEMTAYVVTPTKVFMTTDGGAKWTPITDNLVHLVKPYVLEPKVYNYPSPDSRSITLFDNGTATKADDWVLVGEPGGVFRRMVQPPASFDTHTWQAFGAGTTLPNTFVTSLVYDSKSDALLAGTLGRGAWLLKNASAVIDNGLYNGTLVVTGTNDNDQIQVAPVGHDRDAVRLTMNGKNLGAFNGITGQIIINGLGGDDHVDVVRGVRLPVIFNGAELNNGNHGRGHGNAHTQFFHDMADDVLLEHHGVDDLLATCEDHHRVRGRGDQNKPKPTTLSQTLLGTSQTKEVDTMARASVATAQPPDHVLRGCQTTERQCVIPRLSHLAEAVVCQPLRTDPSRYKKNW